MTRSLRRGLASSPFWVDRGQGLVFVAESAGPGWVIPTDGTAPLYVDTDVQDGLILPGGRAVIYRTSTGALRRKDHQGNRAPVTLVGADVGRFILHPSDPVRYPFAYDSFGEFFRGAVSPDGGWIIYRDIHDDSKESLTRLFLASTAIPGSPVALGAGSPAFFQGDTFTADSLHVLYLEGGHRERSVGASSLVGRLHDHDILSGRDRVLAQSSVAVWRGRGAQVVFGDGFQKGGVAGTHNLYWTDLSQPAAPVVAIAGDVVTNWALDSALNRIAFGIWNQVDNSGGFFTFDLP